MIGKEPRVSLIWGYVFKFLPFLIVPFFSNPWILISAFGIHMLLLRGMIPSWMELLKQNLSKEDRGKICATGSTISYLCMALMPFIFGWLLDTHKGSWRWALLFASLLGMSSIFLLYCMNSKKSQWSASHKVDGLRTFLVHPWKTTQNLLRERVDFFHFQWGFFLGGAGLMTIHAVIPKYFTEYLELSYTGMFFAVCFCKGIGFVLATPLWVRLFNRSEIFSFCSRVPLVAVMFPILLIMAIIHPLLVFLAYFLYGVMQAGSELGWKMSGPVFAADRESTPFSSVNILTVGVRGAIFPYFGGVLFIWGGPYLAFIFGGVLCLSGSIHLWRSRKQYGIPILT